MRDPAELGAPSDALDAGPPHQKLNSSVADRDAVAQGELGMDPLRAIGLARIGVDLDDQIGQPGVADRAL